MMEEGNQEANPDATLVKPANKLASHMYAGIRQDFSMMQIAPKYLSTVVSKNDYRNSGVFLIIILIII